MNVCLKCGTSNRAGARFCRKCRSDLSAALGACPHCGAVLRASARFCKHCGKPVSTAPTAEAHRLCSRCSARVRATARFCPKCRAPMPAPTGPPSGPRCPNCSTPIRPGARFCRICSRPLGHAAPATAPPTRPPSQAPGRFGTGELLPLTTLADGRYVILEKIAQGGMGAIYRAQDKRLRDKVVAVKEMAESAITPDERERILECFKREAELLARLEHPNLVRVSDLFQEQGRHYMVMEFVPGKTLEKMLEGRPGPFPEERVLTWAKQLCGVLSYLHNQNPKIIYRDIKPANVMVVDGTDTVKLIDFGIARFFKPGKRRDTIELGTDGYAPPEQYGKSQTDERADVYALGAMLHQLLTMRDPATVPFKFPLVRSLNPKVSQRVEKAVAKAVQPAVANRYRSIDEMLAALVGDGAPEAKPAGKPAKPTSKPARPTSKPAEPARKPAGKAPSSVPGKLVPTPASLSFGALAAGGGALNRSLTVTIPAGERATFRADVPWLHIYPRSITRTGTVTVMLYPGRLELGRLSLEGVWRWVMWPARFLVPTEQRNQGHVEVESKSGEALVPISVIARPPGWRVFFGWVFAVSLTLGQVSILLVILLTVLGLLFGSIL